LSKTTSKGFCLNVYMGYEIMYLWNGFRKFSIRIDYF